MESLLRPLRQTIVDVLPGGYTPELHSRSRIVAATADNAQFRFGSTPDFSRMSHGKKNLIQFDGPLELRLHFILPMENGRTPRIDDTSSFTKPPGIGQSPARATAKYGGFEMFSELSFS